MLLGLNILKIQSLKAFSHIYFYSVTSYITETGPQSCFQVMYFRSRYLFMLENDISKRYSLDIQGRGVFLWSVLPNLPSAPHLPFSGAWGAERNCVMVCGIWNRLTFPGQLVCELVSRGPSGRMDLIFTSSHHSPQQGKPGGASLLLPSRACKSETGFRKMT